MTPSRSSAELHPKVHGFFDARTFSIQYVVACPVTQRCAIIDPVLDYDEKSGATGTMSADTILSYVADKNLTVEWVLDTHPHADHLSAAHYIKEQTGAVTAIGARVTEIQALWKDIYDWPDLHCDGSQWDKLFVEGESFFIGQTECRILFSPGHTLASITYLVGNAAFVHDTLFMPDSGTARADFPGGSAARLYASIEQILSLPNETRLFTGHDYRPGGRDVRWESSVREQKANNTHFAKRPTCSEFVTLREQRDRSLPMPRLILHALQVNLRAGRLPEPNTKGQRFMKLPLDALGAGAWQ